MANNILRTTLWCVKNSNFNRNKNKNSLEKHSNFNDFYFYKSIIINFSGPTKTRRTFHANQTGTRRKFNFGAAHTEATGRIFNLKSKPEVGNQSEWENAAPTRTHFSFGLAINRGSALRPSS